MNNSLQKALAPTGVLRVAINLGNSLLVTGLQYDGTTELSFYYCVDLKTK